jgi:hypothetical protein
MGLYDGLVAGCETGPFVDLLPVHFAPSPPPTEPFGLGSLHGVTVLGVL